MYPYPFRSCSPPFSFSVLTVLLLLSSLGEGFFPVDWRENDFGGKGTSHQTQTREVFRELAIKFFGIYELTGSMVDARKTIITANAEVDFPGRGYQAREHFDNEEFNAGHALLNERRKAVKKALEAGDAAEARNTLGKALHTLQDFYAHSNWVEMQEAKGAGFITYGGLGTSDQLHFAIPDPSARTCINCNPLTGPAGPKPGFFECPDCQSNLATAELTSGYFEHLELTAPQGKKCAHGGRAEHIIRPYPGINKDSLTCDWSPHFRSHTRAVQLSKAASREYIEQIKEDVTPSQLKLLFGVGPSIGFAIDTTGSMSDVIADTRAQAISIVNARLDSKFDPILRDQPSLYVVVPFNDPAFGGQPPVVDAEAYKAQLGALTASGGGDCPEFSLSGVNETLDLMDAGGNLFLVTDASVSDRDPVSADAVIAKAKKKGIAIWAFIYDSECSFDLRYAYIAQETGGQQWSLPKSDASKITSLVDKVARADYVTLLKLRWQRTKDFLPAGNVRRRDTSGPIAVPVDSAMYGITFSIEGKDASLSVTRPDHSKATATDKGVSIVEVRDGVIISVDNPSEGLWSVEVGGSGNGTLTVSGLSPLRLSAFDFVTMQGRPGHDGYFPVDAQSLAGSSHQAIASIDGNFTTARFELRSPLGSVLQDLSLNPGTGREGDPPKNSFFGRVPLLNSDSLLYVTGEDSNGAPYLRVLPFLVFSQGNGTFNETGPFINSTIGSLPHGTASGGSSLATRSSINSASKPPYPILSGSVPYSHAFSAGGTAYPTPVNLSHIPFLPTSYGEGKDTLTVITRTTIVDCSATISHTTHSTTSCETIPTKSTFTMTITSIIPCSHCSGPNYASSTSPAQSIDEGETISSSSSSESCTSSDLDSAVPSLISISSPTPTAYGSCPPGSSCGYKPESGNDAAEVATVEVNSSSSHGPIPEIYGAVSNETFPSRTGFTVPIQANSTSTGQFPFFTGGGNALVSTTWLAPLLVLGAVMLQYS